MTKENLGHRLRSFDFIASRISDANKSSVYVRQMHAAVKPLSSSMSALVNMLENPDPTQTKSAFDKKIITNALKLNERKTQAFNKVMQEYKNGLLDNELQMNEKVKLKPNEFAAEIRAAVRGMKPADRLEALAQMAALNDGSSLAAVINCPAILTGVSAEEQNRFRDMIYGLHAKEELTEQVALADALNAAMQATDVAALLAKDLGDENRLAEIELGVEAAAKADAAFAAVPQA